MALTRRVINRLWRLSFREVRLALVALRWLVDARLSLRAQPFRTVYERFDRQGRQLPRSGACDARCAREVAIAVRRASRLVPGATCLPQALAARAMLARRGVVSELRVGVAGDAKGGVKAHAWVEVDGRVVIGNLPDLARYKPMGSFPVSTR